MNDTLRDSIRYVKEHFLQRVSIREIKTAIQEFDPEKSNFSEEISNKIDALLNEWGKNHDLPDYWFYDEEGWVDEEWVFWVAIDNLDLGEENVKK
jgi:hypothetical protein